MKKILITDPANVTSKQDLLKITQDQINWLKKTGVFDENTTAMNNSYNYCTSSACTIRDVESIGTAVGPIAITESLARVFENCTDTSNFEVSSHLTNEEYYIFGSDVSGEDIGGKSAPVSDSFSEPFSEYEYLGSHGSDSRMTCLVDPDIYTTTDYPEVR